MALRRRRRWAARWRQRAATAGVPNSAAANFCCPCTLRRSFQLHPHARRATAARPVCVPAQNSCPRRHPAIADALSPPARIVSSGAAPSRRSPCLQRCRRRPGDHPPSEHRRGPARRRLLWAPRQRLPVCAQPHRCVERVQQRLFRARGRCVPRSAARRRRCRRRPPPPRAAHPGPGRPPACRLRTRGGRGAGLCGGTARPAADGGRLLCLLCVRRAGRPLCAQAQPVVHVWRG